MLQTFLREARVRGATLLDTETQWCWPEAMHVDQWPGLMDAMKARDTRLRAAACLQAVLRRRIAQQREDFELPCCVADEEWQVVLSDA